MSKRIKFNVLFALLGAVGGYLYWKFIGCQTGQCAIKSVWYLMVLYGTAIGYLVGSGLYDLTVARNNKVEK